MTSTEIAAARERPRGERTQGGRADVALLWAARGVAWAGVLVTIFSAIFTGSMLQHGHSAYLLMLVAVFLASSLRVVHLWRRSATTQSRLKPLRWIGLVACSAVLAVVWWLAPSAATEPSLSAMSSDSMVTVSETPNQIVLVPVKGPSGLGLFFQPGARVDARAYAAVLRPLAQAGYTVVIPKQPLGIAFLATGAFDTARADHTPVDQWVVGGHSLGGTVAAIDAQSFAGASRDPVAGLLLFASYPATDMAGLPAQVLSISGSNDGLATSAKIDASKAMLPKGAKFPVIEGAVHADFGDYGAQPGDGQPGISHARARAAITTDTLAFMESLRNAD